MSSLYEILELPTGEIILKRGDESDANDPLVTIRFSAESIAFLGAGRFEVAKAMIEAGMDAAGELADQQPDDINVDFADFEQPLLH